MIRKFRKLKQIKGDISLPGDKSISHRALIFSSMAKGTSVINNLADGIDVQSTLNCLKQLGVKFNKDKESIIVEGVGLKGFQVPSRPLDCGNSGTTARLLSGLLIAQNFESKIIGDESLSNRPMERLVEPLKLMGGNLSASKNNTLPLIIKSANELQSINYELIIPSAQVKSSIHIASLHSNEESSVIESVITRDHTERLLNLEVIKEKNKLISKSSIKNYPTPKEYLIPGDISSAAFLIIAALLNKKSELIIRNVTLNKTRFAYIEVLKNMGGLIDIIKYNVSNYEKYGDLLITSSELQNIEIEEHIIPSLIDEIPILAVAGAFAKGKFEIRNCNELRVKESDRIKSICINLRIAGFEVEEYEDGFAFDGEVSDKELLFDSFGDHRIAMAFSILLMLSEKGGAVKGFESVNISNPGFINQINSICKFC